MFQKSQKRIHSQEVSQQHWIVKIYTVIKRRKYNPYSYMESYGKDVLWHKNYLLQIMFDGKGVHNECS